MVEHFGKTPCTESDVGTARTPAKSAMIGAVGGGLIVLSHTSDLDPFDGDRGIEVTNVFDIARHDHGTFEPCGQHHRCINDVRRPCATAQDSSGLRHDLIECRNRGRLSALRRKAIDVRLPSSRPDPSPSGSRSQDYCYCCRSRQQTIGSQSGQLASGRTLALGRRERAQVRPPYEVGNASRRGT
jgi:hypothetical protein